MPDDFVGQMVQVEDGKVEVLESIAISANLKEAELERIILQAPETLGEALLPLGQQLADFSEDKKRLDLLAVDSSGEIVVAELKVDEQFGLTDVQAIAYAGAYAELPTSHYATTLGESVKRSNGAPFRSASGLSETATTKEAEDAIANFLSLGSFEEWEPSQHVRIKLVAPDFPPRVLKNVKWLGDVYDMRIEAIRVQLFVEGDKKQLSFDRVLPLPGDDAFDLTIREREVKRRAKNERRRSRKAVLALLIEKGILKEGDRLWLKEWAFKTEHRHLYDPDNEIFTGTVRCTTPPKLLWRRSPEDEPEAISPASLSYHVHEELIDSSIEPFGTGVADNFTKGKGGPTLEELAIEHGLWAKPGAEDAD